MYKVVIIREGQPSHKTERVMTINIRRKNGTSSWAFDSMEVTKVATRYGHEICKDADGWFYVCGKDGNWNYFATMREAGRFIDDTYWED